LNVSSFSFKVIFKTPDFNWEKSTMPLKILKFYLFTTAFSLECFGVCPNIAGSYSIKGKLDSENIFYIEKIDCSTFAVTRFMGDYTTKIKIGAEEKCNEYPLEKLCYIAKYLDANKISFSFKETKKSSGMIFEEGYRVDEKLKEASYEGTQTSPSIGIKKLKGKTYEKLRSPK
jgi:hypothetical protein